MDRIVRLASVVLLLVACRESTDPLEQLRSLEANRSLWEQHNIHDYGYTGYVVCGECNQQGFVLVNVRSDTVFSVRLVSTGEQVPNGTWRTVDQLFDYAERQLADKTLTVRVEYDSALGYPTEIDSWCSMQDCDVGIVTRSLAPSR